MITPIKQDDSLATHVKMIKKEDALIDWSKSATTIFNLVRGMNPWPVAFTKIADKMLKIYTSTVDSNSVYLDKKDGEVVCADLKNGLTANILANPLSDENEREIVIDNEKFSIVDCSKHFEDGTKFKVAGKMSKVLDGEGNVVGSAPFTRITNTLKEAQIYTLLKLRLAKNSLMRKAEIEQSEVLSDEVANSFENEKIVNWYYFI